MSQGLNSFIGYMARQAIIVVMMMATVDMSGALIFRHMILYSIGSIWHVASGYKLTL